MTDVELLASGLSELGLAPDKMKIDQLIAYTNLLLKWNKVYSLTAITKKSQIITHHLLDGLTVVPYINETSRIIDIGSGMGVPGVILSTWYPDCQVTLLDSNHKKCAFLQQVAIELSLPNVQIVAKRVEDYIPADKYDTIISRAFANTRLFIQLSSHLLKDDGSFIAMKSKPELNELNEIITNCEQIKVKIPGVDDERVLLRIKNNNFRK